MPAPKQNFEPSSEIVDFLVFSSGSEEGRARLSRRYLPKLAAFIQDHTGSKEFASSQCILFEQILPRGQGVYNSHVELSNTLDNLCIQIVICYLKAQVLRRIKLLAGRRTNFGKFEDVFQGHLNAAVRNLTPIQESVYQAYVNGLTDYQAAANLNLSGTLLQLHKQDAINVVSTYFKEIGFPSVALYFLAQSPTASV